MPTYRWHIPIDIEAEDVDDAERLIDRLGDYLYEYQFISDEDDDLEEVSYRVWDEIYIPPKSKKRKRKPVPLLYFFSCESTADDGHWALVAAKNEDQAREILEAHPWGEENGPFKLEKMPGLNNRKAQLITWESPIY